MHPASLVFWSRLSLGAMWVAGMAQLLVLAPHLPERVASHFDLAGHADGWSSRSGFVIAFVLLETFLTAVFLGVGELVLRSPAKWINLPHKDHWLAPERAARTRAVLMRDLAFIGLSTMLLVLFAVHESYLVSAQLEHRTASLGPVLAIYLVVVLGWTGLLCWRYARPPGNAR